MALTDDFSTALDTVVTKVTGTDSIYDKTLVKLDDLYKTMGYSADARTKAMAEVSAQLAVSTTNTAINAAVELAKSAPVIVAQVAEINARTSLTQRQERGFNDKLLVEVMKTMGGVAQMEATSGETTVGTLETLVAKMATVEAAAGIVPPDPVV